MINEPLVSIILVNYNGAVHTLECVKSLDNVNYSNFEIIIVDNASKQEDVEILRSLKSNKRVKLIESNENTGFSGGNNIGLRECIKYNNDYIMLLNNDTVVEPDFINVMLNDFSNDIGLVCPKICNYYNHNEVSYAGGYINTLKGGVFIYGINSLDKNEYIKPKEITFASGCCMLMKADVIKKAGFLPEEYFLYFEDTDFSVRVSKCGYKMWYEPKAVIYHKESVSTEKCSPNYQYYFVRNRFMFIHKNIKLKNKLTAYPISCLYVIKSILKKRFNWSDSLQGLRDFLIGKTGKRENMR